MFDLAEPDETLADYERRGGLAVLRHLPSADRVIEELKTAGLTGFGGAGFPTGLKWESLLRSPAPRVLAVNADEGEPGTIKDRYVLELRPYLLLEGALIAMRALDCPEGYIYLREEYATARARLVAALEELRTAGLLDDLSLELVVGAGAYIAGEETAMLESMEGRRAMPAPEAAVPDRGRPSRPPDADQQRRDARARALHRPRGRRLHGQDWAEGRRREHASGRSPAAWSALAATRRRAGSRCAS